MHNLWKLQWSNYFSSPKATSTCCLCTAIKATVPISSPCCGEKNSFGASVYCWIKHLYKKGWKLKRHEEEKKGRGSTNSGYIQKLAKVLTLMNSNRDWNKTTQSWKSPLSNYRNPWMPKLFSLWTLCISCMICYCKLNALWSITCF